jgi:hypothetical protein
MEFSRRRNGRTGRTLTEMIDQPMQTSATANGLEDCWLLFLRRPDDENLLCTAST